MLTANPGATSLIPLKVQQVLSKVLAAAEILKSKLALWVLDFEKGERS